MYVVPTLDDFDADIVTIYVTENYYFRLAIIDEYSEFSGRKVDIEGMILEATIISEGDAVTIPCPSVIGMKNDLVSILTEDPSMYGKTISKSNLGSWGLEIVE